MAIRNPKQLVDEWVIMHTFALRSQAIFRFKKSGEFDRLRRQLLTHFANSVRL